MSEMEKLDFLVGRWKGKYEDQFGEKGVLESSSTCERILGGRFLRWEGETLKDGAGLNQSMQLMGYDKARKKYFFKRLWSYGFVENGSGDWENEGTIVFDIEKVDNQPEWFEGMRWRSFVRKYSETEIGHGLYASKGDEPFKLYGESRVFRVTG